MKSTLILIVWLALIFPYTILAAEDKVSSVAEGKEMMRIFVSIMKGESVSKEDVDKIETSFKKKINETPRDPRGYMTLGQVYERTGQLDKAVEWHRKSTEVDPNYANGFDALGMVLAKKGLVNDAIVAFEKANMLSPNNWEILTNLAAANLQLKNYDKAIKIYKKTLAADPNNIKTKIRLAQCYVTAEKYEDAITTYEAVLKEQPGLTQLDPILDQLYKKAGKERKSGTAYEVKKSMEKQGYHANVQQVGNIIAVAPIYYEKGKAPITDLEIKVSDEYKMRTREATANLPAGQDKQKVINSIAHEIAQKYNMTDENFTYMILKIGYNEVVPDTYAPPSEKLTDFKDVAKDKYEAMTPVERTAVVRSWSPETDFEKLQQKGLMAEANGDFKNAALLYKEILASREIQDDLIPMMHSALQRCYEKLRDAVNEKSELTWVNKNILASEGKYNRMAQYLTSAIKNHLRERMAKYDIKPN